MSDGLDRLGRGGGMGGAAERLWAAQRRGRVRVVAGGATRSVG